MLLPALVVEVLCPHDETWDKLDFHAAHGVDEVLIVLPEDHAMTWLALEEGRYVEADHSALLDAESRVW